MNSKRSISPIIFGVFSLLILFSLVFIYQKNAKTYKDSLPQQKLVQENLALYLNNQAGKIHVKSVKETTWPDTCLGKPGPEMCAPGKTTGYIIILEASGNSYTYHTDTKETFVYISPGDYPKR